MTRIKNNSRIVYIILLIFFVSACDSIRTPAPQVKSTIHSTGLVFSDAQKYAAVPVAPSYPGSGNLPSSYTLMDNFPTPGYQGSQASCVGWAVAYALKSYQERIERGWSLTSDAHLFSPSYIYNQVLHQSRGTCYSGITIIDALDLVKAEGVAPLNTFPYDMNNCSTIPSSDAKQSAHLYGIETYYRIAIDTREIKGRIAAGTPVLIGMYVDDEFSSLSGKTVWEYPPNARDSYPHAMVVTGYDDLKAAFQVINSWGTRWGDRGYGWIAYDSFSYAVKEAFIVKDMIDSTPSSTPIVRPTSIPSTPQPLKCDIPVYPDFVDDWEHRGGAAISCPTGAAFTRNGAYQYFQNGLMIWHAGSSGDSGGMIYVIYNNGNWQEYSDRWVEGQVEYACNPTPPSNLVVPKRGFGKLWCDTLGGSNARIGWATNQEQATTITIQPFQGTGVIISFPGTTYFLPHKKYWK